MMKFNKAIISTTSSSLAIRFWREVLVEGEPKHPGSFISKLRKPLHQEFDADYQEL